MKPTMYLAIADGVLMQWWEIDPTKGQWDENGKVNGEWREVPQTRFAFPEPPAK